MDNKKKYDVALIGHVSKDINTDFHGVTAHMMGGAILHASACIYALGHPVAAITKLEDDDIESREAFPIPESDIYISHAEKGTSISNRYLSEDKERRICKCISQGDAFTVDDIPPEVDAKIYDLAGLIYGDFPNELIRYCADKGDLAIDVQAFLRHADPATGDMEFFDWEDKREMLPFVRFLKTDAAEAQIMTGTADRYAAAEILFSYGAKEVVITHNTEVLSYDGRDLYTCPIRSRNFSGRTGRGDSTFASYITERLHADIPSALLTATALVSLKMETPGLFRGTRADVEAYIDAFYADRPVRRV